MDGQHRAKQARRAQHAAPLQNRRGWAARRQGCAPGVVVFVPTKRQRGRRQKRRRDARHVRCIGSAEASSCAGARDARFIGFANAWSTSRQAGTAYSGGKPPHSTWCEVHGQRSAKHVRRARPIPQARLISRAPLPVASGALSCVDLAGPICCAPTKPSRMVGHAQAFTIQVSRRWGRATKASRRTGGRGRSSS